MTPRIIIKACRNFRLELEELVKEPEFSGIMAQTYSPWCEHPRKDPRVWHSELVSGTGPAGRIVVLGACFLSGLKDPPQDDRARIMRLDQCFYLLAGRSLIDHYMRQGAYILTPGWLGEWRAHVAEWGFDRETAREFFAESTTKLLLLDTGVDPGSSLNLAELAEFLGLPAEVLPVGLDHLRLYVRGAISEEKEAKASSEYPRETDYAMAIDLLETLAQKLDEEEVAKGILDLFSMLFAPERLIYLPVRGSELGAAQSRSPASGDAGHLRDWLGTKPQAGAWLPAREGFLLPLAHKSELVGAIEATNFAFPEYGDKYFSLSNSISGLCGLVLSNARLFHQVKELADTDGLTRLNSRRRFFELSSTEFNRARRYGTSLSAIMFDIDNFKRINDARGHATGDRVLAAIGACCLKTLRDTDISGRYGGEEFAILLPETKLSQAVTLAERLRGNVAANVTEVDGEGLRATVSLGLADMSPECSTLDELLSRCDSAMYVAKAEGRNQLRLWSKRE